MGQQRITGRREIIAMIGLATAALPRVIHAQATNHRLVAALYPQSSGPALVRTSIAPISEALAKFGWTDGGNLRIENRFCSDNPHLFEVYAKEIVQMRPDVIIAFTPRAVLSLLQQTKTIPIVFMDVGDPVGYDLITSMAKPGGNVTGVANFGFAMGGKWIEILKEAAPNVASVAFLYHPASTSKGYAGYLQSVMSAAPKFGVSIKETPVGDENEIETAITAFAHERGGGLIVPPDPFTGEHRHTVIRLAEHLRLPAVYPFGFFVQDGGLVSYGVQRLEQTQKVAFFVNQILRGRKPADLPAESPSKFELDINLKTANALGLKIPPTLLARADKVIE